jgi:hypothetical protein
MVLPWEHDFFQPRPQGLLRTWRVKNEKTLVKFNLSACAKANLPWRWPIHCWRANFSWTSWDEIFQFGSVFFAKIYV